jgi:acetamidase/formamidase
MSATRVTLPSAVFESAHPGCDILIGMAHSVLHLCTERGPVATEHVFPETHVHYKWDVGNEPALLVRSGDTVTLESRDVSDNQLTPNSTAKDIETLDWDRVYPLAGPIAVEDAAPGDTLAVEILELRVKDWGWTAIIPGLGLLPDDFPSPYLRVFDLTNGRHAFLRDDVAIPIEPFFGTMGVCPSGAEN